MTEKSITVHSTRLAEAINLVKHAAAPNELRPVLATIVVEGDAQGVRLVAADNYRIAIADVSEEATDFGRALVWARDIPLILSIIRAKGTVVLTVTDGQRLTIEAGVITLSLRLCDGTFPDYAPILTPAMALQGRAFFGINPKFLGEVTRALAKSIVLTRIYPSAGPLDPVVVTAEGFREVIMPLRVAEEQAAA